MHYRSLGVRYTIINHRIICYTVRPQYITFTLPFFYPTLRACAEPQASVIPPRRSPPFAYVHMYDMARRICCFFSFSTPSVFLFLLLRSYLVILLYSHRYVIVPGTCPVYNCISQVASIYTSRFFPLTVSLLS